MNTLGGFSAILYKGDIFYDFLFVFMHTNPLSENGSTLKGKNVVRLPFLKMGLL